jgi:hypothetical protein
VAEFQLGSHQFPDERQHDTPVTDAVGLVIILNLLPGQRAARFRVSCARIVVRYLGGDETLVSAIRKNRRAREALPEEHPARIFGQAVESEADKREREADEAIERQLKREKLQNELKKEVARGQTIRLQAVHELATSSRRLLDTLGAGDPPPATLQMLKAAQHNFSTKTLAVMGRLMGSDPAPVKERAPPVFGAHVTVQEVGRNVLGLRGMDMNTNRLSLVGRIVGVNWTALPGRGSLVTADGKTWKRTTKEAKDEPITGPLTEEHLRNTRIKYSSAYLGSKEAGASQVHDVWQRRGAAVDQ